MSKLNAEQIMKLIADVFPAAADHGFVIDSLADRRITLRLDFHDRSLRPGGTLSGPTLMTLADTAVYFMILAELGPVVQAVTTHLSIDFFRRPEPADLIALGELVKVGRRLAVGRVEMRSTASQEPVAQAMVTYALPPEEASSGR